MKIELLVDSYSNAHGFKLHGKGIHEVDPGKAQYLLNTFPSWFKAVGAEVIGEEQPTAAEEEPTEVVQEEPTEPMPEAEVIEEDGGEPEMPEATPAKEKKGGKK